jgi:hypothetical protein
MEAASTSASLAQAVCEERARLEGGYQQAKDAFDTARTGIRQKVGTSSKSEFLTLERAADLAWDQFRDAVSELATHIREHGCGVCEDVPPTQKPIW